MTSNAPPPITPNINTNPDSSQDDSNRPQVNVVTQSSQLTQEFKLISKPAQQRSTRDFTTFFTVPTWTDPIQQN